MTTRIKNKWITSCLALLAACTSSTMAAELYVSPNGNDSNNGSKASPVASLHRAKTLARDHVGKSAVQVNVADGIYYLPETLVFEPKDSGSQSNPVIYRSINEGGAVLSGGSKLDLKWTAYKDGIFQAKTPEGLNIDQLFIDGKRQRMARYPNYDATKKTAAYQGFSADAFSPERAKRWADPEGGYIHAMHRARWGGYHYRITGKNAEGEVTYEGGWQNNRQMGMHKDFRMVENIFEELDAAGEWFHNAKTDTLYFKPEAGTNLKTALVEVVRLRHLVEFKGTQKDPVEFVILQGFEFRHAARTFMDTKEPLLRSDWAIYRGGAVMLTGTEYVAIVDCEFDQVGGNAVFVNNYNRHTLIKGCHIHETGGSGICFVGDPDAVRDPLFEYRQRNDLTKIDRTVGPKTDNYPSQGVVEDCLIHSIGLVERQPAGVQVSMAMNITIRDSSVYDTSRAGINFSEGTWGGHLIERVDVFDTVLETHDHGSFNSWGRDRFWVSDRSVSQVEIDKDPSMPFLDAMHTTVIRDSRWRCDHGWDIDLDDGSSNYDIYNNLMLNGGLKLREGFQRRAWNNIMINNGLHPHVWYNNSNDEVYSNIVMRAPRGADVPTKTATGKRIDSNLFYTNYPEELDRYTPVGWDVNSICADPLFVDPASANFQVKAGSPAFSIGFKNFPMDQFGVKKPSLKAIARTPIIPELKFEPTKPRTAPMESGPELFWLGANLYELADEDFSAYGTIKEDGGVALLNVPAGSAAAKAGLEKGDLIQGLNGNAVRTIADLLSAYAKAGSSSIELKVVRFQQVIKLSISNAPALMIKHTAPSNISATGAKVTSSEGTKNDPLSTLVDGKVAESYGPIFPNGTTGGSYKLELANSTPISSLASWSFNMGGNRGTQIVTIYGSNSDTDPGWRVKDRKTFTPIASIDTSGLKSSGFTGATIEARKGQTLGTYKWLVWRTSPLNTQGENTAFQEFIVE
ncbi:MAG: right-handed parallel beta-helix repeat-containing protein [Opitutaceae bacterium]